MAKTVETFGKIDIMIPVGGIAERFPAEDFPVDAWQRVMDTNVRGTWLAARRRASG